MNGEYPIPPRLICPSRRSIRRLGLSFEPVRSAYKFLTGAGHLNPGWIPGTVGEVGGKSPIPKPMPSLSYSRTVHRSHANMGAYSYRERWAVLGKLKR